MLVHSTVLVNGLRIVIAEQADSPVISAGIFVRQGSRNEQQDELGISHFLEHLIFNNQRAVMRGKQAVVEILDNGGILNAHTTKECTSYEGVALKQHAPILLRALYQLVFEAEFTEEDILAERQVILAELHRKLHSSDQLMDYLSQGIFGNSGYGNWILGSESFIGSADYEKLRTCYSERYVADNVALVMVTSQEVKYLMPIIEELFSQVLSGCPTPIEVPLSQQFHLKLLKQKSDQVFICMGGAGPSLRDEDSKSFEVGITAWGAVPNSRLFMSARERDGLVYQIQSFYNGYVQSGQWGVFSTVSKGKFHQLMAVLAEEINRLRDVPLNEVEMNRTVSVLKTNMFMKLQQPDYFLRTLGRREVFRETIYPNDMVRQYELATPERIQTLTQEFIQPLGLSLVVMGDLTTDEVLKALDTMGA